MLNRISIKSQIPESLFSGHLTDSDDDGALLHQQRIGHMEDDSQYALYTVPEKIMGCHLKDY